MSIFKISEHSLNKRYLVKVLISLILFPVSFVINSLVPRSLGPLLYGKYNFLVISFTEVSNFFESGFGAAYYNKLSQNLKKTKIIIFFLWSRIIFSLVIIFFCSIIFLFDLEQYLWPDQELIYIIMALVLSIFNVFSSTSNSTLDAFGFTVSAEISKLIVNLFGFILIICLYYFSILNLETFFIYSYVIEFLLILGWTIILFKGGVNYLKIPSLSMTEIKKYILDFWNYSNPLLTLSIISSVTVFIDIWLLQKFGGSVQQGFYALAFKLSALAFLFAKPMNSLIMREFSVAFGKNNLLKMKNIFYKYIPVLYSLTAFISIFIFIQSANITVLYAGNEFDGAIMAVSLMSFYPIHQTYGQMSGSVFLASNQTKLYRNITVILKMSGLILSFFLMAPQIYFGLGLGAIGLAIKMLVFQFLLVNIQLFYNSKFLNLDFLKLLKHQMFCVLTFLTLALAARHFSSLIFTQPISQILLCGISYTISSVLIIYFSPSIIGMSRLEFQKTKNILIDKFQKINK